MTHSFPALATMWFVMMSAMMAPTVWPWVAAFHKMSSPVMSTPVMSTPVVFTPVVFTPVVSGFSRTAVFVSGYAVAWFLYSLAAASIQLLLPHQLPTALTASILFIAGAFQFAPIKRACLTHCRNPLTYFLTRWRDGRSGGFRMGFGHGLFCVACCWALMATTLAVGVMSLWWMAALALVTFAEQVSPWGDRVRIAVGVALMGAAAMRMV